MMLRTFMICLACMVPGWALHAYVEVSAITLLVPFWGGMVYMAFTSNRRYRAKFGRNAL